jgi:hypothetical protein
MAGLLWLHAAAAARLVEVEVTQVGEHRVLVGELAKSATHYVFSPRPGAWLTMLAKLAGRIQLASPRWPDERATAPAAP